MTREQLLHLRDGIEEQLRWAFNHCGDEELLELLRLEAGRISARLDALSSHREVAWRRNG